MGVLIHNIKDQTGETASPRRNPLDEIELPDGRSLAAVCRTYDWVADSGRANSGSLIEEDYQLREQDAITDKIKDTSGVKVEAAKPALRPAQSAPTILTPRAPWCS